MNRRSFFRGLLAAPLVPIAAPRWWEVETPLPRMVVGERGAEVFIPRASAEAIARVEAAVRKLDASIGPRAVAAMVEARKRGVA